VFIAEQNMFVTNPVGLFRAVLSSAT